MLHMDKNITPPSKPPRVSVPLTDEVLQVFQRLAKAGNMSTGRAIAEWLGDTVEAAEYMAATMERARAAPKVVMREMHAYALGLADETGDLIRTISKKGKEDRAARSAGGGGSARALHPLPDESAGPDSVKTPRLVIRGGKSTSQRKSPQDKKP